MVPPIHAETGRHWRPSAVGRAVRGLTAAATLGALVVGVPWVLVRYVGWPLPDRLPSWAEIQAALTTPPANAAVLDLLAVLCWAAWAVFLLDVVQALPAAVRAATSGLAQSAATRRGPLHGVAAVLVTSVAVALLAPRLATHPIAPTAASAATATVDNTTQLNVTSGSRLSESSRSVVVREPRNGIHDCLWRIADRELGDGARWPEIYDLNRGRPQPGGGTLTDPNLIHPGWVLILPGAPGPEEPSEQPSQDIEPPPQQPTAPPKANPTSAEPSADPTPVSAAPTTGPPETAQSPDAGPPQPDTPPGIDLGPGFYIGAALAAAISTLFVVARRRQRRWYEPGSGHRADLPTAPVIRTLRVARLIPIDAGAETDSVPAVHEADHADVGHSPVPDQPYRPMAAAPQPGLPLGVGDDQEILMDLAGGRGLGLVGPGADKVARAILLTVLTGRREPDSPAHVLIPEDDARRLLGTSTLDDGRPAGLSIVPSLEDALDQVDEHIGRLLDGRGRADDDSSALGIVVMASPRPELNERTQAVLENGSSMGVAGVVLGQWRPGGSVHVRDDGTVSATNPGPAERLLGARLFTLPTEQAKDMLALLRETRADTKPADSSSSWHEPDTRPIVDGPPEPQTEQAARRTGDEPLSWRILGVPTLRQRLHDGDVDITPTLTRRQRELLAFLSLHPDGVARDTLADALWPDSPDERPTNALHATLSRIRRALIKATGDDQLSGLVITSGDRYRLNAALIEVDYWSFTRAVQQARTAATGADRMASDREIISLYRAELAAGVDADWLEVPREAARRDAIDAAARLARTYVDTDPHQALRYLEQSRAIDPYNELVYRDIMRLQARLGQSDAIQRTLGLLTIRLAELQERPDPETLALAQNLQSRAESSPE